MSRPMLADAFGHHVWATLRLVDACLALSPEQLASAVPGTYGSILETARHPVGSDGWYLFDEDDGYRKDATIGIRFAQALHHGTDHRSQICTALTALEMEPPSIDAWEYGLQVGRVVATWPGT